MWVSDVANKCNLAEGMFLGLVGTGFFPKPNIQIRNRQGYTEKAAERCVAKFNKVGGLVRPSHLADKVGCSGTQIQKWIVEGKIPEPKVQAYASGFYTGKEVGKILTKITKLVKEYKETKKDKISKVMTQAANKRYDARRKKGFFSTSDVARMSKVSPVMVNWYQNDGSIKHPKLEVKGYFGYYYTRKQANRIVEFFKKRKKK